MNIYKSDTIVFYGDSITFHCRDVLYPGHLGGGYVNFVAAQLHARLASPDLKIYNRGISGDRIYDLENRLERDVLPLAPTIVSLLAGVNDTLLRYSKNVISPVSDFAASYRRVLEKLRAAGVREFILLEPFLLPVDEEKRRMREDLSPRIDAIRQLAVEFQTAFIPLDGLFAEAATRAPAAHWTADGVHPGATTGDGLIADAWMQRARILHDNRPAVSSK
jgi:lysophospholipase L1-like esterase